MSDFQRLSASSLLADSLLAESLLAESLLAESLLAESLLANEIPPPNATTEFERRRKPRLARCCPALVRGVDAQGQAFEEQTFLHNLSVGDAYLTLSRRVSPDARLLVVFHFETAWHKPSFCVALRARQEKRNARRLQFRSGGCVWASSFFVARTDGAFFAMAAQKLERNSHCPAIISHRRLA